MFFWKKDREKLDKILLILDSLHAVSPDSSKPIKARLNNLGQTSEIDKTEITRKLSESSDQVWEEDILDDEEREAYLNG